MRRRLATFAALAATTALGSCGGIDKILEGNPLIIKLNFSADSGGLIIPQGSAKSLRVRVTPTGDVLKGAIAISVDRVPTGITATIDSIESVGTATSARITINVSAATQLGPQEVRLAARAAHANEGGSLVRVSVVPPATLGLTLAKPTLTVAQGGVAPITAQLTRTSLPLAVKLALDGAPTGISATFDPAGTTADATTATVVIAATVAPGTYNMNVRASAPSVSDQLAPLTVNVTNDAIQLIADVPVSTPQTVGSAAGFFINRGAGVGAVTLTAENVPAGVSAVFDKPVTTDPGATITFTPSGTAPAGDYTPTIRAQAAGFPDATTTVALTVLDASIAVAATPAAFEVLQGQNTQVSVAYARTRFTGSIGLSVSGLPALTTATPQPANTTGNAAAIVFGAAATAVAGTYDVNVIATPAALGASKVQTTIAKMTVRAVPAGANVVLDWTGCTMPQWIASQNGTVNTAWSRVTSVGSLAGFLVNAGRGGYAWYDGASLNVRYALQGELTAGPIVMCPPPDSSGVKSITGIGIHTNPAEVFTYTLGGGTGTSTTPAPAFTIFGVRDGKYDLVASGFTASGQRTLIRRDLDLPNGSALDPVDLTSTEGFGVVARTMAINIGLLAGEGLTYSYNYLTTPACVENRLSTGFGTTAPGYNGIPDNVQRPTDYHEFFVSGTSSFGTRTMSVAFHTAANKTMLMPTLPTNAAVASIANTPYARLQTTVGSIPAAYNRSATLTYHFNQQGMSVSATNAYIGFANILLAMPDFTSVSGFQQSYAIPAGAAGLWRLALEGSSVVGSRCTEGRSAVNFIRTGAF